MANSKKPLATTRASGALARENETHAFFREAAKQQRERGIPHNTRRAYASDWRQFEEWCQQLDYPALPTTSDALCAFLLFLSSAKKIRTRKKGPLAGKPTEGPMYQASSIERKLAAIVKKHLQEGKISPRSADVTDQMHAIWVEHSTRPTVSAPILGADLKAMAHEMVEAITSGRARDVTTRDRAVLLIAWHCALRRSEVTALDLDSIELLPQGITVHIGRSKTDQQGRGRTLWIKPVQKHPAACPVAAVRDWLALRGRAPGPLFCHAYRHQLNRSARMPAWQLTTVIDRWVAKAKVQPESEGTTFSPHSVRAGYITHAIRAGRLPKDVMGHSGHKSSQVFDQYVRVATGFEATTQDGILDNV